MSDSTPPRAPLERGFEIYGVRVAVGASDRDVLDRLVALLPAGAKPCDPDTVDRRFIVLTVGDGIWRYESGNGRSPMFPDLALVIPMLDGDLRRYVASSAPDRVFVHAGAVAYRGRAIVIPGQAFSGKTTLVAALARAGAVYYSDEYAVLDERGFVHPYARPLSIRQPDQQPNARHTVESMGGTVGEEPVPVGLIAATKYIPGADFSPERRSSAQGMLTLLAHATGIRERSAESMAALRGAASSAVVIEGNRGEADAAAQALLEIAGGAFPNGADRARDGTVSSRTPADGPHVVAFEIYGTGVSVRVPRLELVPRVIDQFPAHASRWEPQPDDWLFELVIGDDGRYALVQDGTVLCPPVPLQGALWTLRRELFLHSVHHARNRLVVSAGVVGHEGRAVVLPGPPKVGKTMLVAALARAGAVYYADDWALLDGEGLVHPLPTLLYMKNKEKVSIESLGGVRGDRPIPVGLIASITFRPGARWDPQQRTEANGMLKLMRCAYGMDEPRFAMEAARRAAAEALVIEGERDDASEAAAALLEILSEPTQAPPPSGSP
jgi:hypothetical protein